LTGLGSPDRVAPQLACVWSCELCCAGAPRAPAAQRADARRGAAQGQPSSAGQYGGLHFGGAALGGHLGGGGGALAPGMGLALGGQFAGARGGLGAWAAAPRPAAPPGGGYGTLGAYSAQLQAQARGARRARPRGLPVARPGRGAARAGRAAAGMHPACRPGRPGAARSHARGRRAL